MSQSALLQEFATKVADGPLSFAFDRGVERSATAAGLCKQLEGKSLQLRPGNDELAVFFMVSEGRLRMQPGVADKADAELTGTPLSLARLSAADPERVIREGDVRVSGDTDVAEQFRYLLKLVQPDWEDELSKVTGDVVAHELGEAARGLFRWARQARRSVGRSLGEYLTEESAALASAPEIEDFCSAVDTLAADTDRLEARLRLLQRSKSPVQPD